MPCVTFNPPNPGEMAVGWDFTVGTDKVFVDVLIKFFIQFAFNLTIPDDLLAYSIFIYNTGQMFVGNSRGLFGSNHILQFKQPKNAGKSNEYHYPLKQIHWKMLNQEKQPCKQDAQSADTTKCIMAFLEREIGCSMILQGQNRNVDL